MQGTAEELAGSADDMGAALALMGNVLEDLPEAMKHSSQHEAAFLPAKCKSRVCATGTTPLCENLEPANAAL